MPLTEEQRYDQFDNEFRETVDSFLFWRRMVKQGSGLDYDVEQQFKPSVDASASQARREALRIIAILKADNGL